MKLTTIDRIVMFFKRLHRIYPIYVYQKCQYCKNKYVGKVTLIKKGKLKGTEVINYSFCSKECSKVFAKKEGYKWNGKRN